MISDYKSGAPEDMYTGQLCRLLSMSTIQSEKERGASAHAVYRSVQRSGVALRRTAVACRRNLRSASSDWRVSPERWVSPAANYNVRLAAFFSFVSQSKRW
jgi:hypothetical protein